MGLAAKEILLSYALSTHGYFCGFVAYMVLSHSFYLFLSERYLVMVHVFTTSDDFSLHLMDLLAIIHAAYATKNYLISK